MKYYRLIDEYGEPYYSGYNETDLKNLAECIYDILQPDEFINPDGEYDLEKIYEGLLAGERDFIIFVEEADEPFEAEGEYGGDECGMNYSKEDILKYASTRDDLKDYDEDCLVEYVWSFSTHNGLTNKPLSEIIDQFTYENRKDNLFDYLNNILFTTHTQVMNTARERFNNELGITIDENDLASYVSEFIDQKELYDLDYED